LNPGLSFADIQKNIGTIQENLRCIWAMQTKMFQEYANVTIVTKPLDEDHPYENPKIKPWQMYLGLDFTLDPIINDNNAYQMFLLGGSVGSGKTRLICMILLSYILSCKVNEVEIYLSDIAKNEFVNFQYVKHVRYYASELAQLHKMMRYIKGKMEERSRTISKYREAGTATNIKEYNQVNKVPMSYCYVFIDEFSLLVPDKTDNEEEREMKQVILDILKRIVRIGRSLGIFTFISLQKISKAEMGESIIKNLSAVRISFRANDTVSSEVILGNNSAVGLADRYAIYSQNGGEKHDYLFSPCLTTTMLNEMLKPYIDKNFRKADLHKYDRPQKASDVEGKKPISSKKRKPEKDKIYHHPVYNSKEQGDEFIDY
jgi:S-DNA-T family DNA segregation ATPase FtsK/SpoIIIE